jgi:Clostripain family
VIFTLLRRLAAPSLVVVVAGACVGRPAVTALRGDPKATWTLLVYMAADDDLEQAAIANVVELAEVGSSAQTNVVIQIDRAAATRNGRGYVRGPLLNAPDFNSTKRFLVDHGALRELADLGETSTADPDVLAAFVGWGVRTFPAKKTALVLWDHGGATRGFGWDITNDDRPLSIVDARRGIAAGLAASGRAKLDVLGFDACLMSNLGVAYELRSLTNVFIGSEEVEPAHGWSYAPVVRAMVADVSPPDLAKEVVTSFEAACRAAKTVDFCTLAAFDATKLDDVVTAVDAMSDALHPRDASQAAWYPVARARVSAEEYGASGDEASPYSVVDADDFANGAARLVGEPNGVAAALRGARIAEFHGPGKPRTHGMSLTIPRQAKEQKGVDAALELATHPRWQGFLDAYVAFVESDKAPPQIEQLVATTRGDAVTWTAHVPAPDVAETPPSSAFRM